MGVVYITGTGIITGLGNGKERTMEALRQHRSAVGKVHYLHTEHDELPVSEVPYSNDEMKQFLGIQQDTIMTRTALIGRMALKEALEEARLDPSAQPTAFINGTTVGGMDRTEMFEDDFIKTHDCGACTAMIAGQTRGFSFMTTMSTACSSAANAILFGKELVETGRADIAIAGGAECITKFHLNGFNSLMILDKEICRPFDKSRNGLNLGEGAGYIVLESEESVKKRKIKPLAILSGTANRCDAFHQTATSTDGEGSFLAMTDALKEAKLKPEDINYINAHGTGTKINDLSEGHAIMRVFGDNVPPVASAKAFIGHTTSAAGGVEAVISILALKENYMPISLNFNEKEDELNFEPLHEEKKHEEIKHVMSNSFGFGGNDTVCIFSKVGHDSQDGIFRQDGQDLQDEIFRQDGQDSQDEIFRQDGQDLQDEIFRQDGQDLQDEIFRQDGQDLQDEIFRQDGQDLQDEIFRQDGQDLQDEIFRQDGQDLQDGIFRQDGQDSQDGIFRQDGQDLQDGIFRQDGQDLQDCSIKVSCAAQISAQNPLSDDWFENPISFGNNTLIKSQDPDYKLFINPMAARRMGSILKRAIATSKTVMEKSGISTPDAIITATGWGCLENTEKFLHAMTEQGEKCLQPTSFINSTHNTIGSNIAILTKNHGYNNTHVHQEMSFESALLDAVLQFETRKIKNALVGAFDEMTPQWHKYIDDSRQNNVSIFDGETAVSIVLSENGNIELVGVKILHHPDFQVITHALSQLCNKKGFGVNDIDLVVSGRNNSPKNDSVYDIFDEKLGFENKSVNFKNIFGESLTSSAFGFYFALKCLEKGCTPDNKKINNILIYNHFNNIDHSLILLSK